MNKNVIQGDFKIGIYVRESRDDHEENIETIETQKDLLVDFAKKQELGAIVAIYIDDNVSGSGFERFGLSELKRDVHQGNINLLLLKDLSRLGRNNAKTLLFLDFLEEFGVRVITFDGRYDSVRDNETVGIETWFNERYIRDISKKIRASLKFKIQKGEYLGHAPYGYCKSKEEKNKLEIDHQTASIVKEIFGLYRMGFGYSAISSQLNKTGALPPCGRNQINPSDSKWNAVSVRRILGNRVYRGDTVQGVSEKVSFKSKKTRRLGKECWIITEGTHDAIIDVQEFEEVQKIREEKGRGTGTYKIKPHLLKGLLFCGRCGSPMFSRTRKNRPLGYICGSYCVRGKGTCSSHYVRESTVCEVISLELLNMLQDLRLRKSVTQKMEKYLEDKAETKRCNQLEQRILLKQKQQDMIYIDRLDGRISEQQFIRTNIGIENMIRQLQNEIEKIRKEKHTSLQIQESFELLEKQLAEKKMSRQMILAMVERITVYDVGDTIKTPNFLGKDQKTIQENGALVTSFLFGPPMNGVH